MIIGIISIILGAIFVIVNMTMKTESAFHQTVQYLGFLISVVLILGGVILISIKRHFEELNSSIYSLKDSLRKEDTRPVNPTPTVNTNSSTESQTKKCKQCSKRIGANLEKCPYCGSTEFLWD